MKHFCHLSSITVSNPKQEHPYFSLVECDCLPEVYVYVCECLLGAPRLVNTPPLIRSECFTLLNLHPIHLVLFIISYYSPVLNWICSQLPSYV